MINGITVLHGYGLNETVIPLLTYQDRNLANIVDLFHNLTFFRAGFRKEDIKDKYLTFKKLEIDIWQVRM